MQILNTTGQVFSDGLLQPFAFLLIIIVLIIYIGYLHVQLNRKINYINTLLDRIMKLTSNLQNNNMEEIIKKLVAIEKSTIIPNDRIQDETIVNYLFSPIKDYIVFVHYTQDKQIAENILSEGFRFVDSFYKTAERVINDKIDFINKHNRHKHYGKYIIVICISKDIYDYYAGQVKKLYRTNVKVEQILTEKKPGKDENNELLYTLPAFFIKGYINYQTGEITDNPRFNGGYNSVVFEGNLKKIGPKQVKNS